MFSAFCLTRLLDDPRRLTMAATAVPDINGINGTSAASEAMTTMMTMTTQLVVTSCDGIKGSVDVIESTTMEDVRALLMDEFDEDMLPSEDWAFFIDGIRLSAKQETRRKALDVMNKNIHIESKERAKFKKRLPTSNDHSNKRPKRHHPTITPEDQTTETPPPPSRTETINNDESKVSAKDNPCESSLGSDDPIAANEKDDDHLEHDDHLVTPLVLDTKLLQQDDTEDVKVKSDSDYEEGNTDITKTARTHIDKPTSSTTANPYPAAANSIENRDAATRTDSNPHAKGTYANGGIKNPSSQNNTVIPLPSNTYDKKDTLQKTPWCEESSYQTAAQNSDEAESCGGDDNAQGDLEALQSLRDEKNNDDDGDDSDATEDLLSSGDEKSTAMVAEAGKKKPPNAEQVSDGDTMALDDDNDGDDDKETSPEQQQTSSSSILQENPHKDADEAMKQSQDVLNGLDSLLKENELFCSDTRRKEWLDEIQKLNESSRPQTIFGVLGNTGVGKSSLLNALLDEAAVLPTSGSRGCTAAVVELLFNSELLHKCDDPKQISLYKGVVEFMQLEDWRKELKVLVAECSTQEKTVYVRPPEDQTMPDAAAAWTKIDQVYGRGTMENFKGMATNYAYNRLANDSRVVRLLTVTQPGATYNSITVTEGEVLSGSEQAMDYLQPYEKMKGTPRRYKKACAKSFRNKINSYVYRKGNGEQAQTWPLIRKVTLNGPWGVLSTGACLVDLPGVRDANAARAKVSESYLQNCNHIAVVAPIKRAVDDGTAKELLGEQFKRRLLMDGQYGNVFFICTKTDDLEATETMRDHADVAKRVDGRWEKMNDLSSDIGDWEKRINDKLQIEDDLKFDFEEAAQGLKEAQEELHDAKRDDEDTDDENVEELRSAVTEAKKTRADAREKVRKFRAEGMRTLEADRAACNKLQRKLKTICARVRNEYSTRCLREDFKAGLEQLYNEGEAENQNSNAQQTALPEDFNMDVFCISANDYLKLMRIKPSSDGPPNTFSEPNDTGIVALRAYIHQTTARYCTSFAKTFVENSNDLLDRMNLLASDADVPTGRSAYRSKSIFEAEVETLEQKFNPIAKDFQKSLNEEVKSSLTPSLSAGSKKGTACAMTTVDSWGGKNRRSKHERRPDKNGLYWSTYNAVVRRDGVYTSGSAGAVDFNQELCDPMEREFSTDWQRVMDSNIFRRLQEIEVELLQICTSANQTLARRLQQNGLDNARLANMLNTSLRGCSTAIKAAFQAMRQLAIDSQRELSRCLLPSVKERMKNSYNACLGVARGSGVFNRMKGAMHIQTQGAVSSMFGEATGTILNGISDIIRKLERMIMALARTISKTMESVFSICWEDQAESLVDPAMQQQIRACRDAILPELKKLCDIQKEACRLLYIEIEDVDLEMMAVETFEKGLERRMEEAKKKGNTFDLCDDHSDDSAVASKPVARRVKSEPGLTQSSRRATSVGNSGRSSMAAIDLCESDDDSDIPPPSGLSRRRPSRIKADPDAFL